ncbi:hypothetical protein AB1Y20_023500 [Prymnesium parvum]|uniref:Uncharacterized protein n=1 Tax=Prymnesium parvum TaxID=97485 RepID=A0AB34JFL4_PRYPA
MARRWRCWLGEALPAVLMLATMAMAGFTMDEAMAIHPDGTPVNPEAMRDALRNDQVPGDVWKSDQRLLQLVASDDLAAFTDYMQELHADRIFEADGSARDIREWRQSVRDDDRYSMLLQQSFPYVYNLIVDGTDDQVQDMLRAQRRAQSEAAREARIHQFF